MVSFVNPVINEFNHDMQHVADGSKIIQRFAVAIDGRDEMTAFLGSLVRDHAFEPLSTIDFIRLFREYSGQDMYANMINWTFDGSRDY
jgi:aminopeptidase N